MTKKGIPLIASYEAMGHVMCDAIRSRKKSRNDAACEFMLELCRFVDKYNKEIKDAKH